MILGKGTAALGNLFILLGSYTILIMPDFEQLTEVQNSNKVKS